VSIALPLATTRDAARRSPAAAAGQIARLAIGDFRERSRTVGFLVMLVAGVWSAHIFLPANHANYSTLQILDHRPLYSSAYVGTLVAIMTTVFYGAAGFYLVKDAIERDRRTRVGAILAATGLSNRGYTLAKALSNFLALASLAAVLATSAGVLQMVRGEERTFDLIGLLTPFVWITLPYLALIGSIAVLFEAIPWLRGGLGNVVWFFAWIGTIGQQGFSAGRALSPWRDPTGMHAVMEDLIEATRRFTHAPPSSDLRMSVGLNIRDTPWDLTTFPWAGFAWTPEFMVPRLFWFAVAIAIAALAAIPFDRFDRATIPGLGKRARDARVPAAAPGAAQVAAPAAGPLAVPVPQFGDATRLASLPAPRGFGLLSLVGSELAVALKGLSKAWFFVAIAAAVVALFIPLAGTRGLGALLWIWPILVWSAFGTREAQSGTAALFDSAPRPLSRQLPASWLAGVAIAALATGPVAIRLAMAGESAGAATWLAGVAFVPAFALACGALSGTPRLFEAFYLVLWYAGPVNRVPMFDFGGASVARGAYGTAFTFAAAAAVCLVTAHLARRRRMAGK